MTNNQLKKLAKETIEGKLGFKVALTDITLLEANHDGSYVRFTRWGFHDIEYVVRFRKETRSYMLTIENVVSGNDLLIL